MNWLQSLHELSRTLEQTVVTDASGSTVAVDAGFDRLSDWVVACRADRRRVYFIGNGASASMASHFSVDLAKMANVPTEVFTDCALITATGNDFGYAQSFAYPLAQRMVAGEVLIAISSSGNSTNVVEAVQLARSASVRTVTVTAMAADNTLRGLGELNFYIPAETYGNAESGHAAILHHLIDLFT
jgi:D-sedoheptulose 7-phosphate isomerase